MQIQHVAPSRPDVNEPVVGSARRNGAAPARLELAREWPPAAKVRGELARAVGFSRRQFEGRSGPAGSVALSLLMAPDRSAPAGVVGVVGVVGVTRWTPTRRTSAARSPSSSSDASASSRIGGVNVERESGDGKPECSEDVGSEIPGPLTATSADGRLKGEPLDGAPSLHSISTPERTGALEHAATPRWTRPLVDRALTSVLGARRFDGTGDDSVPGARWREREIGPREPALGAEGGWKLPRISDGAGWSAPIAAFRSTLRREFTNHARRTPQTVLSEARRAFAKCEQLLANAWSSLEGATTGPGASQRADLPTGSTIRRGAANTPPLGNSPGAAVAAGVDSTRFDAPTREWATNWATSEWASAAVFTSLLALLFML